MVCQQPGNHLDSSPKGRCDHTALQHRQVNKMFLFYLKKALIELGVKGSVVTHGLSKLLCT